MLSVVVDRAIQGWSLGVGAVLLLCSLVVGVSLGALPDGADGANAANYALTTVMFLGPLVGGLTATVTGQDARNRQHELATVSPRGRLGAVLVVVVAGLLWGVTAHLGVLLAAGTRATTAVVRPSDLSLVLAAWSLLLASAVAGACLGTWLRSPRAGLWAAGGLFALLYGGGYLEAWSARAAPIYPGTAFPIYLQPNAGMVVGKSLVLTAMSVGALTLLARPFRRLVLAGVLALGSAGAFLVGTSPAWPAVPAQADRAVCQEADGLTVCTWPQHADRAEPALEALAGLEATIGSVYPLPRVYREDGAGPPAPGDVLVGSLPATTAAVSRSDLAAMLAQRTLPTGECPDAVAGRARQDLGRWVYLSTSPVAGPPDTPEDQVARWVAQVGRCAG